MIGGLLSPHLSLAEFLATRHAYLWGEQYREWLDKPEHEENARRFAGSVFERVREMTGRLYVSSGYRCPALNAAVGGRATSRHILGLAADVIPLDCSISAAMDMIARAYDAGALQDCDEAIREMGWIHIQASPVTSKPRRLALQTDDGLRFTPYERRQA